MTIWNQKIYESNLQNCSSQSEPLYTAATPLHFSCFLCQTQLIDHIKQIEIQLLAGGHERITFGDNRVKGRGTPLEQIIDCEYEIKVMLSVFLRENKSKDQTGKEAGRKQTNCQSQFYCVTNGWLLWILLFIIWLEPYFGVFCCVWIRYAMAYTINVVVLGVEHDLFTSFFVNHQCSCSDFQSIILSASCWFCASLIRYLNAFIMYIPKHQTH